MRMGIITNTLVIVPVSVLRSWENESHAIIKNKCAPNVLISVVSSDVSRDRRIRILREAMMCTRSNPTLIITTYGLIGGDYAMDFRCEGHPWNYVILDEGHKIKNTSTKVAKNCRYICNDDSTRRLLLTGTPIMNNLKGMYRLLMMTFIANFLMTEYLRCAELWALFDWCTTGKVLGSIKRFQSRFGVPIENGRQRNADKRMLQISERANADLQELLRPHFLQRMKTELGSKLPRKEEFVVWTHLSPKQRRLYETYVSGEHVASVLAGDVTSPLEAVTWLKKLCGHPLLVEYSAANIQVEIEKSDPVALLNNSAKLNVLATLMKHLSTDGHRTLIFSQSTKTLDIIQRVLQDITISRIDGSTKEKDRQRLVDEFNAPASNVNAMLVSTKAGGLGLTLTGADRAIIFDPSWNPAEDSQAVDRCYRIGQQRDVQVFRLITSGTVEEKMYEKQVYKDSIRRTVVTSSGNLTARFFDRQELSQLFKLAPAWECEVLQKLGVVHSTVRSGPLLSHPGVVGISSHDNIFENGMEVAIQKEDGPFVGTPAKKFLGRSQRALQGTAIAIKDAHLICTFSISDDKENLPIDIDDDSSVDGNTGGGKSNAIIDMSVPSDVENTAPSKLEETQIMINQNDDLGAMSLLLDMLETKSLLGMDKIKLHKQIANLSHNLEWL